MNLFIDTHLNDVILVLIKDGKIIKEKIISNEKEQSKVIMPSIKKLLGKKIPEAIVVVNGPGSFTGVRLGVTIAKTLAYSWEIPIYTVTSLECMAVSTNNQDKIVAFSDNNGYYVGIFDESMNLIGNYEYIDNSAYEKYSSKYDVLTDKDITVDFVKIVEYALSKKATNAHEVDPIYVKKIAVEND